MDRFRQTARRLATIHLIQNVLKKHLTPGITKIHHHVRTLTRTQQNCLLLNRRRIKPRILPQLGERLTVAQPQLKKSGVAAIQKTQSILPTLHLQNRLHTAIRQPHITQLTIMVQQVIKQCAVRIEFSVLQRQRNIISHTRQHVAANQIVLQFIRNQIESRQSIPDIRARDIHRMVMKPHRTRTFREVRLAVQQRHRVRVVIIPRSTRKHVEIRIAVRMRRTVPAMQMRRQLHVQLVVCPHHTRLTNPRPNRRSRNTAGIAVTRSLQARHVLMQNTLHPQVIKTSRQGFVVGDIRKLRVTPQEILRSYPMKDCPRLPRRNTL